MNKLSTYIDEETYKAIGTGWVDLTLERLEQRIYELLAEPEKPRGWYYKMMAQMRQQTGETVSKFSSNLRIMSEKAFGQFSGSEEAQGALRLQFLGGLIDRELAGSLR